MYFISYTFFIEKYDFWGLCASYFSEDVTLHSVTPGCLNMHCSPPQGAVKMDAPSSCSQSSPRLAISQRRSSTVCWHTSPAFPGQLTARKNKRAARAKPTWLLWGRYYFNLCISISVEYLNTLKSRFAAVVRASLYLSFGFFAIESLPALLWSWSGLQMSVKTYFWGRFSCFV